MTQPCLKLLRGSVLPPSRAIRPETPSGRCHRTTFSALLGEQATAHIPSSSTNASANPFQVGGVLTDSTNLPFSTQPHTPFRARRSDADPGTDFPQYKTGGVPPRTPRLSRVSAALPTATPVQSSAVAFEPPGTAQAVQRTSPVVPPSAPRTARRKGRLGQMRADQAPADAAKAVSFLTPAPERRGRVPAGPREDAENCGAATAAPLVRKSAMRGTRRGDCTMDAKPAGQGTGGPRVPKSRVTWGPDDRDSQDGSASGAPDVAFVVRRGDADDVAALGEPLEAMRLERDNGTTRDVDPAQPGESRGRASPMTSIAACSWRSLSSLLCGCMAGFNGVIMISVPSSNSSESGFTFCRKSVRKTMFRPVPGKRKESVFRLGLELPGIFPSKTPVREYGEEFSSMFLTCERHPAGRFHCGLSCSGNIRSMQPHAGSAFAWSDRGSKQNK